MKKLLVALAIVLSAALGAGGTYIMLRDNNLQQAPAPSASPTPQLSELEDIKQAIGALIILPMDEEPALATITDRDKITTPFLSKSQNGDKVLLYNQAKRAIIYRPAENKLVDVGPLDIIPVQ